MSTVIPMDFVEGRTYTFKWERKPGWAGQRFIFQQPLSGLRVLTGSWICTERFTTDREIFAVGWVGLFMQ